MKKHLFTLVILAMIGCSPIKDFKSFSKQLYKQQKRVKECGIYPKISYNLRNQLTARLDFINYNQDTIFLLESYDIETGIFNNAIWTDKGKIEYESFSGNITVSDNNYFIERLYQMIECWDSTTIRQEEEKSSNMLGREMMFGARIVINKGELDIQCIRFNEFFDLQKDVH